MEVKVKKVFDFLSLPLSAETQVCFRYYHGVTGALRATTPSVTIKKGSAPVSVATPHSVMLTYAPLWHLWASLCTPPW